MTRGCRLTIIALVLLAYLPPLLRYKREKRTSAEIRFVEPKPAPAPPSAPFFQTEFIPADPLVPSVHVASVCEASDGRLCAAWYGGAHEGARDVNIFWSKRLPGEGKAWSKPEVLVSRSAAMRDLRRPIKKLGNAVLFAGGAGQLRLIYVSVSIGGWSTSSLNVKSSFDDGQTWLPSQRLTLSPFFNLSELVKNNPGELSDGGWAIPIYHECLGKFPEILWLKETAAGLSWRKSRICGGRSALQPALVPLNQTTAVAFLRDYSPVRKIHLTRSTDAGRNWSSPQPIALPNSDSGLDALRLADGRILLAFNDSATGRENLSLALSGDGGQTWLVRTILESGTGQEFSYPYLIQTKDGQIHLVYTYERKAIKHAAFNLTWLDAQNELRKGAAE